MAGFRSWLQIAPWWIRPLHETSPDLAQKCYGFGRLGHIAIDVSLLTVQAISISARAASFSLTLIDLPRCCWSSGANVRGSRSDAVIYLRCHMSWRRWLQPSNGSGSHPSSGIPIKPMSTSILSTFAFKIHLASTVWAFC